MKANEVSEQYISKSAVVAEIERLKNTSLEYGYNTMQKVLADSGKDISLRQLQNFIDTLEVKEVDLKHLEQEVKDFCYEYDDRKEKWYELCPNDRKLLYNPTWANFAMSIAKHFFELGISVNNKEHKGEKV